MLSTFATVALPAGNNGELTAHLVGLDRPFACLYRPQADSTDAVLFLEGDIELLSSLSELTLDVPDPTGSTLSQLVLLPFNQLKEKGYACIDDGEQVIVMHINKQQHYPVNAFIEAIEEQHVQPKNLRFDLDNREYGEVVNAVINQEIGAGEGSNFVISRSLEGDIAGFGIAHALTLFKRLLQSECGAYWTWMVYTGSRYFIGSTPEQHIQVNDRHVAMNPISGTLRYPEAPQLAQALDDFLLDTKERDELFMVVDEELKMMSNICQRNIQVSGPKLKAMSYIAHTEYFIDGESDRGLQEILRHSLFAPTVTGSPIANACKVIARREQRGRGYYSGVVAISGLRDGKRYLDSAIVIRSADISTQGRFRLTAGSTIVRDSVARNEASETRAKLQGLMYSFFGATASSAVPAKTTLSAALYRRAAHLLVQRNEKASSFWLGNGQPMRTPQHASTQIVLIDMEDAFTAMIAYQLRSTGYFITVMPWCDAQHRLPQFVSQANSPILFIGPGPGDPTDMNLEKIRVARRLIAQQLRARRPLIGTCLGHQLICTELGIPIMRLPKNRQGSQYQVSIQGRTHYVGFYNSFSATSPDPCWYSPVYDKTLRLERLASNEIIALSSGNLASIQFHNESFLTQDAFAIYRWLIQNALRTTATQEILGVF